jgi:hypothetical protein
MELPDTTTPDRFRKLYARDSEAAKPELAKMYEKLH